MPYGEKKNSFAVPEVEHDAIWMKVKFSSFFFLSFKFEKVSFLGGRELGWSWQFVKPHCMRKPLALPLDAPVQHVEEL